MKSTDPIGWHGAQRDDEQIEILKAGREEVARDVVALDVELGGNRGSHRYSFGAPSGERRLLPPGRDRVPTAPSRHA